MGTYFARTPTEDARFHLDLITNLIADGMLTALDSDSYVGAFSTEAAAAGYLFSTLPSREQLAVWGRYEMDAGHSLTSEEMLTLYWANATGKDGTVTTYTYHGTVAVFDARN